MKGLGIAVLLVIALFSSQFLVGAQQAQTPAPAQQGTPQQPTAPKPALAFGLEDGTPVKLRLQRTLSSADAKVGDTVDFDVLEEVKLGETVIIPKGSIAWATVTEAQPKRRMGRGGKLNVNIDSVRLADGEKVALRAVREAKGGGHTGAMTGAMVATGIVFFPAAPLFLFMHGKDIVIPKGTEITAYINGDTPLDRAKFEPKAATAAPMPTAPDNAGQATLQFTSTPEGADIEMDGAFVGTTPSTVSTAAGEHSIKITKKGYKAWERKLRTSSGTVKVAAELEQEPKQQ